MAKSTIRISISATESEKAKARAYVQETDRDLLITSFDEITVEIDRLVAEAFIAGARSRTKLLGGHREAAHEAVVEALHDGGFGTVGYDSVGAQDVADDVLDALGYAR